MCFYTPVVQDSLENIANGTAETVDNMTINPVTVYLFSGPCSHRYIEMVCVDREQYVIITLAALG